MLNYLVCVLSGLVTIMVTVVAIGIMLRVVSLGEGLKQIAAILALITVLVVSLRILYAIWSGMSLTSLAALIVVGVLIWRWRRPTPKRKGESE
jgi:CHASE2 domain-containing sensor protein